MNENIFYILNVYGLCDLEKDHFASRKICIEWGGMRIVRAYDQAAQLHRFFEVRRNAKRLAL